MLWWQEGSRGSGSRLYAEAGNGALLDNGGKDHLHGAAGNGSITGGADAETFRLLRCGLMRSIAGMTSADALDMSDAAPIPSVTGTRIGSSVEITAGIDKAMGLSASRATMLARIVGATIIG